MEILKIKIHGRLVDTAPKKRGIYMSTFEINRDTEKVYAIKIWGGQCLWFATREERDAAYLMLQ